VIVMHELFEYDMICYVLSEYDMICYVCDRPSTRKLAFLLHMGGLNVQSGGFCGYSAGNL
jgi:hypothetical protein